MQASAPSSIAGPTLPSDQHQYQDPPGQNSMFPQSHGPTHNFGGGSSSSGLGWGHSQSGNAGFSGGFQGGGASLSDHLAQSRPQYQSGYLMSLSQSQAGQPGSPRYEDPPLIPTKVKMNPAFSRSSPSDFGSESMFESSKHRHRDAMDDEDGPPTGSVFDIVTEVHTEPFARKSRPINMGTPQTSRHSPSTTTGNFGARPSSPQQVLYVTVFGYPASRFSSTVAYFKSLSDGGTTDVEQSMDVENAFIVGYNQPWEAARAWRKNGEVINGDGGRWMVGVKWVDPALAERILGFGARSAGSPGSPPLNPIGSPDKTPDTSYDPASMQLQRANASGNDSVIGTPMRLAPSSSAFKRPTPNSAASTKPGINLSQPPSINGTPVKGVLGQVSDLIFGW